MATGIERPIPALAGRPFEDLLGYDLRLITYREIVQTKSRTVGNYWLQARQRRPVGRDPVMKNTTLSDLTGGSAVFYDTQVKVTKA